MNKTKLLLLLIMMVAVKFGTAQSNRIHYSGQVNAGAMFGSNNTKINAQTIHGVKSAKWFAGIGGSIDDYFLQSFPVFIDLRRSLFNKPNTPFAYVEGGINISKKGEQNGYQKTENKVGAFYEGGIGYKVGISPQLNCNLSAGYSFKGYTAEKYIKNYNPINPKVNEWENRKTEKYRLNRFVLRLGLEF